MTDYLRKKLISTGFFCIWTLLSLGCCSQTLAQVLTQAENKTPLRWYPAIAKAMSKEITEDLNRQFSQLEQSSQDFYRLSDSSASWLKIDFNERDKKNTEALAKLIKANLFVYTSNKDSGVYQQIEPLFTNKPMVFYYYFEKSSDIVVGINQNFDKYFNNFNFSQGIPISLTNSLKRSEKLKVFSNLYAGKLLTNTLNIKELSQSFDETPKLNKQSRSVKEIPNNAELDIKTLTTPWSAEQQFYATPAGSELILKIQNKKNLLISIKQLQHIAKSEQNKMIIRYRFDKQKWQRKLVALNRDNLAYANLNECDSQCIAQSIIGGEVLISNAEGAGYLTLALEAPVLLNVYGLSDSNGFLLPQDDIELQQLNLKQAAYNLQNQSIIENKVEVNKLAFPIEKVSAKRFEEIELKLKDLASSKDDDGSSNTNSQQVAKKFLNKKPTVLFYKLDKQQGNFDLSMLASKVKLQLSFLLSEVPAAWCLLDERNQCIRLFYHPMLNPQSDIDRVSYLDWLKQTIDRDSIKYYLSEPKSKGFIARNVNLQTIVGSQFRLKSASNVNPYLKVSYLSTKRRPVDEAEFLSLLGKLKVVENQPRLNEVKLKTILGRQYENWRLRLLTKVQDFKRKWTIEDLPQASIAQSTKIETLLRAIKQSPLLPTVLMQSRGLKQGALSHVDEVLLFLNFIQNESLVQSYESMLFHASNSSHQSIANLAQHILLDYWIEQKRFQTIEAFAWTKIEQENYQYFQLLAFTWYQQRNYQNAVKAYLLAFASDKNAIRYANTLSELFGISANAMAAASAIESEQWRLYSLVDCEQHDLERRATNNGRGQLSIDSSSIRQHEQTNYRWPHYTPVLATADKSYQLISLFEPIENATSITQKIEGNEKLRFELKGSKTLSVTLYPQNLTDKSDHLIVKVHRVNAKDKESSLIFPIPTAFSRFISLDSSINQALTSQFAVNDSSGASRFSAKDSNNSESTLKVPAINHPATKGSGLGLLNTTPITFTIENVSSDTAIQLVNFSAYAAVKSVTKEPLDYEFFQQMKRHQIAIDGFSFDDNAYLTTKVCRNNSISWSQNTTKITAENKRIIEANDPIVSLIKPNANNENLAYKGKVIKHIAKVAQSNQHLANPFIQWQELTSVFEFEGMSEKTTPSWRATGLEAKIKAAQLSQAIKRGSKRLYLQRTNIIEYYSDSRRKVVFEIQQNRELSRPTLEYRATISSNGKTLFNELIQKPSISKTIQLERGLNRIQVDLESEQSPWFFYRIFDEKNNQYEKVNETQRFYVASREIPIRYYVEDNSWVRIYSPDWPEGKQWRTMFIDKAQAMTLAPEGRDNQAYQLFVAGIKTVSRALEVEQNEIESYQAQIKTMVAELAKHRPKLDQNETVNDQAKKSNFGTWAATLGLEQRRNFEEVADSPSERFLQASLTYWHRPFYTSKRIDENAVFANLFDTNKLYATANLGVRSFKEGGISSLFGRHRIDYIPSKTFDFSSQLSHHRHLSNQQDEYAQLATTHGSLQGRWHYRWNDNSKNTFRLGLFSRSLNSFPSNTPVTADNDVYTRYKQDHRHGLDIGNSWEYYLTRDSKITLSANLRSNEIDDSQFIDRISTGMSWQQFYKGSIFRLALSNSQYSKDYHRLNSSTATRLSLKWDHDIWQVAGDYWRISAHAGLDLDQSETEIGLRLSWGPRGFNLLDDISPLQTGFRSLRQHHGLDGIAPSAITVMYNE